MKVSTARSRTALFLLTICCLQLGLLIYNPRSFLPPADGIEKGREALKTIEAIDGDVWVVRHCNLSARAGKGTTGHSANLSEFVRDKETHAEHRHALMKTVEEGRYAAIIVSPNKVPDYAEDIVARDYVKTDGYIECLMGQTANGWTFERQDIYLRRQNAGPGNPNEGESESGGTL